MKNVKLKIRLFLLLAISYLLFLPAGQAGIISRFGAEIKHPNVAGSFYPDNPEELSRMIDNFISVANPQEIGGRVFALISPHAGYGYSGQTAAYGYKLIAGKDYTTVIIIGPSHFYGFKGVSVYPQGALRTPLGDIKIDQEFTQKLLYKDSEIYFEPQAFTREHSIEVQLPFLQKALSEFKIVPVIMGDCILPTCEKLAVLLAEAINGRKDVLLVVSTDMYHGYDYEEAEFIDNLTLNYLKDMDAQALYSGLREGKLQLCGGLPAVTALILADKLGHKKLEILEYTNSAQVTSKKTKGVWAVGYASCAIDNETACLPAGREKTMLNKEQKKKLLEIARNSIYSHLKSGNKLELVEADPHLLERMGAFVTLHESGQLRGCIGNLIGNQPLYLTVRDMAVESAVGDPRFPPLQLNELKDIKIEISVLSPMQKVSSAEEVQMGKHGVLVKRGLRSGVFLPQVAVETGWTKEEFLSQLCSQKAGLSHDAWKDKNTDMYIFSAEVFAEE